MSDPNGLDVLYPEVEVRATADAFSDSATHTGDSVNYAGSPVTGSVTISGFANLEGYHWQARVKDEENTTSPWASFGGNAEDAIDFKADMVTPEVPTTLDAVALPSDVPTYASLTWYAATDEAPGSGFAGYNYYKSIYTDSSFSKVNTGLITTLTTTDEDVTQYNFYYFRVTSQDNAQNESVFSDYASAPNLVITKNMSVEAPTGGGYGGDADDAVPGAAILYTVNYSNNGFGIASGLEVVDEIPDYTDFKTGSATGERITAVSYSNDNGATFNYTPTTEATDPNVTNIKWECSDTSRYQDFDVEFRVIIR
jgi:uncharacterized repeat protein (TIGR01451 family)